MTGNPAPAQNRDESMSALSQYANAVGPRRNQGTDRGPPLQPRAQTDSGSAGLGWGQERDTVTRGVTRGSGGHRSRGRWVFVPSQQCKDPSKDISNSRNNNPDSRNNNPDSRNGSGNCSKKPNAYHGEHNNHDEIARKTRQYFVDHLFDHRVVEHSLNEYANNA